MHTTPNMSELYAQHIEQLQRRAKEALERESLSALVIHSGQSKRIFLDDMDYPFKVNPHFKAWLPVTDVPNCWLIVNGVDKPKLIYFQPSDFWHKVIELNTEAYWVKHFDIVMLKHANEVESLLPRVLDDYAYIGEHIEVAQALGFEHVNPDTTLNYLHYHRAYKTDYELACMRCATSIALKGHLAAKNAFYAQASEFEIHHAYLLATQQDENQLPYSNIIGLNEHGAVLHYTGSERVKPVQHLSLLIDAGAQVNGYASDITRTYAYQDDEFNALITRLDDEQQQLCYRLKPGQSFADLHVECYLKLAQVLVDFKLVKITAEQAVQQQIVRSFFPHGLGHHLGLQVHDVGGFMADARGTPKEPPAEHPYLRTTRTVEAGQVLTIEPGLYFIDCLLASLKKAPQGKYINWQQVEKFKPYGGIRIEDNVIVHQTQNENMTRELSQGHV